MTKFTVPVEGHWVTDEGTEMANRYADIIREDLSYGSKTDLEVANAIYMVGRSDLELIGLQTAAKERIRWLSVQLAMAKLGVSPGVLAEVDAERRRQIVDKGWTPEHDDEHKNKELIYDVTWGAAEKLREAYWTDGYRRELVQVAAMVVAEIERLDREATR